MDALVLSSKQRGQGAIYPAPSQATSGEVLPNTATKAVVHRLPNELLRPAKALRASAQRGAVRYSYGAITRH